MLKELKKGLKGQPKQHDDEIREEIEQIKNDIDFLYSLVQPDPPDLISLDNYDYGVSMQLTEEMYNEIVEYSENKTHIFIGIC